MAELVANPGKLLFFETILIIVKNWDYKRDRLLWFFFALKHGCLKNNLSERMSIIEYTNHY